VGKKKHYDDKFRASAVIMMEAAGYPDKKGALMQVAGNLGVPHTTLSRWFRNINNPPPNDIAQEKRKELKELLEDELHGILGDMPGARFDASYRDLGVVAGILFDKLQLLKGKPTEIIDDSGLTDETRADRIAAIFDRARDRRDRQSGRGFIQ
jgi:transposase-like protein